MKLSDKAWSLSSKIVEAIKSHPFNQELMKGTLELDKFMFYLEQDTLYLRDFARCLAIIASKAPQKYTKYFLQHSELAVIAEQEIVHKYFKKSFNFQETRFLTPATLSYTSYLLNICSTEPIEIGIAAIAPCFWVYKEVGIFIAKLSKSSNPYARWIETYSGEDFSKIADEVIDAFDEVAKEATEEIRNKMLDAFYKSVCLEWHFWNDAYNKEALDDCHHHGSKLARMS